MIDEALLRIRFGQVEMGEAKEQKPELVYLAYRRKWMEQFLLAEDGDDVVFQKGREVLYRAEWLGRFDGLDGDYLLDLRNRPWLLVIQADLGRKEAEEGIGNTSHAM